MNEPEARDRLCKLVCASVLTGATLGSTPIVLTDFVRSFETGVEFVSTPFTTGFVVKAGDFTGCFTGTLFVPLINAFVGGGAISPPS